MYFYNEKKRIVSEYLSKISCVGKNLEILNSLSDYINETSYKKQKEKYNIFESMILFENITSISEVFSGEKEKFLEIIFGKNNGYIFKKIWDNAPEYIYSIGYNRRSYRTNQNSIWHINKNIGKFTDMLYLSALNFSLKDLFENENIESQNTEIQNIDIISDWIALELDNNNEYILSKIKDIVYSENNTNIITHNIIKALFMTKNQSVHKMTGDLLIAAKLQEGLRQSILEHADEGSKEAFIYILKIIIDNDLMRFSSVVRAFDTWTGLILEVEKPKVIKKCFEAAFNCLKDGEYRNNCINSDDNLLIYIGLWAVAFYEINDIMPILNILFYSKEKYKKLTALQFLSDTGFDVFKHSVALNMLDDNDLEVTAFALNNIYTGLSLYDLINFSKIENGYQRGKDIFYKLKNIMDKMPKKELEYNQSIFSWINIKLTKEEILEKMMIAIIFYHDEEDIDVFIDNKENMSIGQRSFFIENFLKEPINKKQKLCLIESCGDRAKMVRESAFEVVNNIILTKDDYTVIEEFLKYKSGDMRKSAIQILLKQDSQELLETIKKLTESKNENKILGAIDIISEIEKTEKHKHIFKEALKYIDELENISQKGKILTEKIDTKDKNVNNYENGFGLYDKNKKADILELDKIENISIENLFSITYEETKNIIEKFIELIEKYKDYEYEVLNWDGSKREVTLGGDVYLSPMASKISGYKNSETFKLDNYPIADKVKDMIEKSGLSILKLLELDFYIKLEMINNYNYKKAWYSKYFEAVNNYKKIEKYFMNRDNIKYFEPIQIYISLYIKEISKKEKFEIAKDLLKKIYTFIPIKKYYEELEEKDDFLRRYYISEFDKIGHWLNILKNNYDDKSFKEYFTITYNFYRASNYNFINCIELENFAKAFELKIIDENEIYQEILERPNSKNRIREISSISVYNNKLVKYQELIKIAEKAIETITKIEVKRGELNTEVTDIVSQIQRCYGIDIFISIILSLDKDGYVRGYNFVSGDCTKKQMLSHLLKCCYPKKDENAEELKKYIKDKKIKIKSEQLIEACMYSTQWIDIVSEYLNLEGLKSACWYFHSHVNDYFSNEKSAITAKYTPISTNDLKDGAFDKKWFLDAYNTLGKENFEKVYESAKYIAGGALHKRSQLFADAVLGKLNINEIKERVQDKRNKDYLLTYSLIPIQNKEDLLKRYEYICQYKKESKNFGSQRQASEARSADIALVNLSINAGYSDINRLMWDMETLKLETLKDYMMPKNIEDIEVRLTIDENGQSDILCTKNDKILKNIPSKFSKNDYIKDIKELKKSLKEQYIRAKNSFENAMEKADIFTGEEIINLSKNPIIFPIIKNLVFKLEDKFGYIDNEDLSDYKEIKHKINKDDKLIIAHPLNMYEAKCWTDYQKDIFKKNIVQPFKQVFRELYFPNQDELKEGVNSKRYAGHQIQLKKGMALLKSRGWIINNEEGIQKIYYDEDIIAVIYANIDWYSPAEAEPFVIDYIGFENRKTFKPVKIEDVPKLIFSEIMRDIDLLVSTAYVGGVDPEASMSTIEVRKAIIEEIIKLKKLSNVELKKSHAYIKGKYGEYTVHLGSAIVHKMGKGAVNIIAVHSEHRGKIFLPFIDSDPKSVEIISKIILLAEDTKIKDPNILEQIK